ncbi:uncharacterized protein LOC113464896, partial [Ceratina calcarata]|uniref:Uncharacterized protein LOC113464896 n=1 Tax=Ceratina calcarata TaxID=156304 RepID=A0AAJ7WEG3_9HYME
MVASLFEFVVLLALTGALVSVVALLHLMGLFINIITPVTTFMLNQSGRLVILEVILTDLGAKFPNLRPLLRPQYAPYLNTAGTVLLGWLIISWISYIIWSFLAPLTISFLAVILICPTTAKWCVKQTVPGLEIYFSDLLNKFHSIFSEE